MISAVAMLVSAAVCSQFFAAAIEIEGTETDISGLEEGLPLILDPI
jgi:hypothetical protein